MNLAVHLLPLFERRPEWCGTAVVVDVLRASTTICFALQAGAKAVIPCVEEAEARSVTCHFGTGECVVGGERGAKRIDGFDLGNSPEEYTPTVVAGKIVVLTTEHGTRALRWVTSWADSVLVGGLCNLDAVVEAALHSDSTELHVVCAGTGGDVSLEDAYCAGALANRISERGAKLNDAASLARAFFIQTGNDQVSGGRVLAQSIGGRRLSSLGLGADIETCSRWNSMEVVPRFMPGDQWLTR